MDPSTNSARLNRLPIIALFTANAISMIGNVLANLAIPWFVLQTTGSATQTGLTGFFAILAAVLAGIFGGTLIDRLGYKRTSILSDLASGITVLLIPLLHFTVGLAFWPLMALVFLGGLLDAPGSTARAALTPELAALAGMPIERATSLNQVVERSSRLLGAPLAGVLIALIGTANVLWIDAASFFISVVIVGLFIPAVLANPKTARLTAEPAEGERKAGYFDELMAGLRFLRADTLLMGIVVVIMITNFLDATYFGVALPVYVNQVFASAVNLGLIVAVNGGGAVVGGLLFGWIGHRLPRHATFAAMFVVTGLQFWVFLLDIPFPVLLAAIFVSSIGAGPLNPIIGAVEFERIPAGMRGRVFGMITAAAWSAMPLGMLLGGVLTDWIGVRWMFGIIAGIYLAVTLSIAFIPAMKQMNRPVDVEILHKSNEEPTL